MPPKKQAFGTIQFQNPLLRDGFSQLPNRVLKCGHLSIASRLMYSILLSYGWNEGSIFPGQERLAKDLGISSRQVRKLLKELENEKFIEVARRGLTMTNVYILLDFYQSRPDLFKQNLDKENISSQEGQEVLRSSDGKILSPHGLKRPSKPKRKNKSKDLNNGKYDTKDLEIVEHFKARKLEYYPDAEVPNDFKKDPETNAKWCCASKSLRGRGIDPGVIKGVVDFLFSDASSSWLKEVIVDLPTLATNKNADMFAKIHAALLEWRRKGGETIEQSNGRKKEFKLLIEKCKEIYEDIEDERQRDVFKLDVNVAINAEDISKLRKISGTEI